MTDAAPSEGGAAGWPTASISALENVFKVIRAAARWITVRSSGPGCERRRLPGSKGIASFASNAAAVGQEGEEPPSAPGFKPKAAAAVGKT